MRYMYFLKIMKCYCRGTTLGHGHARGECNVHSFFHFQPSHSQIACQILSIGRRKLDASVNVWTRTHITIIQCIPFIWFSYSTGHGHSHGSSAATPEGLANTELQVITPKAYDLTHNHILNPVEVCKLLKLTTVKLRLSAFQGTGLNHAL